MDSFYRMPIFVEVPQTLGSLQADLFTTRCYLVLPHVLISPILGVCLLKNLLSQNACTRETLAEVNFVNVPYELLDALRCLTAPAIDTEFLDQNIQTKYSFSAKGEGLYCLTHAVGIPLLPSSLAEVPIASTRSPGNHHSTNTNNHATRSPISEIVISNRRSQSP